MDTGASRRNAATDIAEALARMRQLQSDPDRAFERSIIAAALRDSPAADAYIEAVVAERVPGIREEIETAARLYDHVRSRGYLPHDLVSATLTRYPSLADPLSAEGLWRERAWIDAKTPPGDRFQPAELRASAAQRYLTGRPPELQQPLETIGRALASYGQYWRDAAAELEKMRRPVPAELTRDEALDLVTGGAWNAQRKDLEALSRAIASERNALAATKSLQILERRRLERSLAEKLALEADAKAKLQALETGHGPDAEREMAKRRSEAAKAIAANQKIDRFTKEMMRRAGVVAQATRIVGLLNRAGVTHTTWSRVKVWSGDSAAEKTFQENLAFLAAARGQATRPAARDAGMSR